MDALNFHTQQLWLYNTDMLFLRRVSAWCLFRALYLYNQTVVQIFTDCIFIQMFYAFAEFKSAVYREICDLDIEMMV